MKLREFVDRDGGFVKHVLEDMLHRSDTRDKIADPAQWHENLEILYNDYYSIFGYIEAAYHYNHISFDDEMSLEEELGSLLRKK